VVVEQWLRGFAKNDGIARLLPKAQVVLWTVITMKSSLRRIAGNLGAGLAAALLLCSAVPTQANEPTHFFYTDTQLDSATDWTHAFDLPQFNPSLGLLESVTVHATFTFTTSGTVFNDSRNKANFTLQEFSALTLLLPGESGTIWTKAATPLEHYTLQGFGSDTFGAFTTQVTVDRTICSEDFQNFIGTGLVQLIGSTQTWQDLITKNGNPGVELLTSAGAFIKVEYEAITPVPEPSAAGLFIIGMAVLCTRLLRRSKMA
jgi:hypothetical protein